MQLSHRLILPLVLALALGARAQIIYVLDPGLAGVAEEVYLPSTLYPAGATGYHVVLPLPNSSISTASFGGGIAIDQSTSRVFVTDGVTITTDFHNLYAPFTAPPPLPGPFPAPVLLSGGPVSGMGADVAAGLLWMTDGISYGGYMLGAPFGVVIPPVPLPFALAGTPLTGIDFDAATGTLWGCDAIGNIYHWFPGGGPVGPQPVSVVPLPAGSFAGGLAVNDANGPGALAPHFCSTQTPGYHVVISDGNAVYDAINIFNAPIACPAPTGVGCWGLAYSNDFQVVKGLGFQPPFAGIPGWAKPNNVGIGGPNALRLTAAPPLTTALFLYDLCPIPGGLFIPFSGETLWINPFSITFNFGTFVTSITGDVNFPINFVTAPVGINFVGQWAIYDPPHPLGYALTDCIRFISGTN